MKTPSPQFLTLLLLAVVLGSSGCSWSVGCPKGGDGPGKVTQPTQGAELIDLQKARDQGAITDQEYEQAKQKRLGN